MRQVCCAIINSKFGEMWAGNLNLYILRCNGMEVLSVLLSSDI